MSSTHFGNRLPFRSLFIRSCMDLDHGSVNHLHNNNNRIQRCYIVLHFIIHTALYYIILYCIILYHAILYLTVLYYTILYCTI